MMPYVFNFTIYIFLICSEKSQDGPTIKTLLEIHSAYIHET